MGDIRKINETVAEARAKFADLPLLRSAVQAIPVIGGPLDTLLAGKAHHIQMERIRTFIDELARRMDGVERLATSLDEEALFDLTISMFERAARTRSSEKRRRFARILARQAIEAVSWDDAGGAARLLDSLEEIHIEVASIALSAPIQQKAFVGLRVVMLGSTIPEWAEKEEPPLIDLLEALPHYAAPILRMACAELIGKGLFQDVGIGRYDTPTMRFFQPTDLSQWLFKWIADEDDHSFGDTEQRISGRERF